MNNEEQKTSFSKTKSYQDIDDIVDQILDLQELLKQKVREIIK